MTRKSPRQAHVANTLRERILTGKLKAGVQLPHRTQLAQMFNVSGITIQRALDQLAREGHVQAIPGKGTFVTLEPPHLHRIGIVIPYAPVPDELQRQSHWSHYWTVLAHVAEQFSQVGPFRYDVYYDITGHTDAPDYIRLKNDLNACRLAGLVLLCLRYHLRDLDVHLSRVPTISLIEEAPCVMIDMASFFSKALEYLLARGRRRIAVLLRHDFTYRGKPIEELFKEHGLVLPAWRKQFMWAWSEMEGTSNAVQLLLRGTPDERPDGLIIADDHLVTNVSIGVVLSGLAVPTDIDIVAYANFPVPTLCHVPAYRLGLDVPRLLTETARVMKEMRTGKMATREVLLPAINAESQTHILSQPTIISSVPE